MKRDVRTLIYHLFIFKIFIYMILQILTPLLYEDLPLYCPPSFFQILSDPSPCSFVASFFDWMGDHITSDLLSFTYWHMDLRMSSLGIFSTTGTLLCVLCNKASVYWGLTHDVTWFLASTLVLYHTYTKMKTLSTHRANKLT